MFKNNLWNVTIITEPYQKSYFIFHKSFTYFLQQFISTCLMLIFMTFNMYLILSITLGMATGYYLTGFIRIAHQLKLQDQDCCWYTTPVLYQYNTDTTVLYLPTTCLHLLIQFHDCFSDNWPIIWPFSDGEWDRRDGAHNISVKQCCCECFLDTCRREQHNGW